MAEVTCCNPTDHEILLALLQTENDTFDRLEQVIQAIEAGGGGGGGGTVTPTSGALTDRSGTITVGGASQQLAAANATRKYFMFENVSSETLWINFGVVATQSQPSIKVLPNGYFFMEDFFVSNQTINVIGATTGSAFTAKEA